jgi:hypothetical protein
MTGLRHLSLSIISQKIFVSAFASAVRIGAAQHEREKRVDVPRFSIRMTRRRAGDARMVCAG